MLTSAYLAPVQYYTKIYRAPYIMEERGDHYVKQTYRNRTVIAGPDGPLPLTIPIEHGSMARPLSLIHISEPTRRRGISADGFCL